MDPSIQFLLGNDVPKPDGATIHSLVPPPPEPNHDVTIGFTLDVTMRLDQEQSNEVALSGAIVSLAETSPRDLADSA